MIINPSPTFLSIVIPAFNEEARIPLFLDDLIPACQKHFARFEIIVVDDGSGDATSRVVCERQQNCASLKLLTLPQNKGKGYAVKFGLWRSAGDVAAFLDADGSTSIDAILTNLHLIEEGYDIVVGSRVLESNRHQVQAKLYRKRIGQVFNFFVNAILLKGIEDTQCGFKMFRRQVIRPLFSRVYLHGFGFDLEFLFLAQKMGLKIKEVPVNWKHVDGSKVDLFKDSWRMFVNIIQIRQWHPTPLNSQDKFMTLQEIRSMHELEREHWWFVSKANLVGNLIRQQGRPFEEILDAGCGTGGNHPVLSVFGRYTGSDLFREALEFCAQSRVARLVQSQVEDLPFEDRAFDLVTSLDVIEHIEDPGKALMEFKRVLKDDGIVIITVPAFRFLWSEQDDALCHMRRYDKKDLIEQMRDAGFQIQKTGYFFCATFLPVVMIRKIRGLFPKQGVSSSDTSYLPPAWLNALLKTVFAWETHLALRWPLPWGTTIFAVASKIPAGQPAGVPKNEHQPAQIQNY